MAKIICPPDWFSLDNYPQDSNYMSYDLFQWQYNLSKRLLILITIDEGDIDDLTVEENEFIKVSRKEGFIIPPTGEFSNRVNNLESLSIKDVCTLSSRISGEHKYAHSSISRIDTSEKMRAAHIKSTIHGFRNHGDMFYFDRNVLGEFSIPKISFPPELTDIEIKELLNQLDAHYSKHRKELKEDFDEHYGMAELDHDMRHVKVNIDAPIPILLDELKKWIISERKKSGLTERTNPQKVTEKKLREWTDSKIMQYIDLYIWKKLENKSVTEWTMAEWIFSDVSSVGIIDKFANTKKKVEKLILEFDIIGQMAGQTGRFF